MPPSSTEFKHAFGSCEIKHPNPSVRGGSQAFNQADAYALQSLRQLFSDQTHQEYKTTALQALTITNEHLNFQSEQAPNSQIQCAVIEDAYGAIGKGLSANSDCLEISCFNDYQSSVEALLLNKLNCNICTPPDLQTANIDLAICRIPKQLSYFEFILESLSASASHHNKSMLVIFTVMQKYMNKSYYQLIEQYSDKYSVLPGFKKAKAIYALIEPSDEATTTEQADVSEDEQSQSFSDLTPRKLCIPEHNLELRNLANVFSQQQLDIGTRFLLSELESLLQEQNQPKHIVDLGCGNGALAIKVAKLCPKATISLLDHSALAIASAQLSLKASGFSPEKTSRFNFVHSNIFSGFSVDATDPPVDLILCNPPFHQEHSVSEHVGIAMLKQSSKRLCGGGKLIVVANRHLPYLPILKSAFSSVTNFASNQKFIIYLAIK